jgi:FtsH-binding integral membrane protein
MYIAHNNLALIYNNNKNYKKMLHEAIPMFRLRPNITNLIRMIIPLLMKYSLVFGIIVILSPIAAILLKLRLLLLIPGLVFLVTFLGGIRSLKDQQSKEAISEFLLAALMGASILIVLFLFPGR